MHQPAARLAPFAIEHARASHFSRLSCPTVVDRRDRAQYTKLERTPAELADADSRFHTACHTTAHYKSMLPRECPSKPAPSPASRDLGAEPSAAPALPGVAVALFHGFGANTWSWAPVQGQLADEVNGLVTAHCMPGFGLTERSRDQRAYTLRANGDIGRQLQALELARCAPPASSAQNGGKARGDGTTGVKRILVGHSLGCAGIATSFVNDPQGVDGIVLVSPAIMANPFTHRVKLETRSVRCALSI